MTAITVTILGEPVPQGSKRVYGGHVVDDNAAKLKPWRATITAAIADALPADWDRTGPMHLQATFRFPRPLSHYRANGQLRPTAPLYKATRPDLDKLARAAADSITDAHAWKDDAQLALLSIVKIYAEQPALQLSLRHLDPLAPSASGAETPT